MLKLYFLWVKSINGLCQNSLQKPSYLFKFYLKSYFLLLYTLGFLYWTLYYLVNLSWIRSSCKAFKKQFLPCCPCLCLLYIETRRNVRQLNKGLRKRNNINLGEEEKPVKKILLLLSCLSVWWITHRSLWLIISPVPQHLTILRVYKSS